MKKIRWITFFLILFSFISAGCSTSSNTKEKSITQSIQGDWRCEDIDLNISSSKMMFSTGEIWEYKIINEEQMEVIVDGETRAIGYYYTGNSLTIGDENTGSATFTRISVQNTNSTYSMSTQIDQSTSFVYNYDEIHYISAFFSKTFTHYDGNFIWVIDSEGEEYSFYVDYRTIIEHTSDMYSIETRLATLNENDLLKITWKYEELTFTNYDITENRAYATKIMITRKSEPSISPIITSLSTTVQTSLTQMSDSLPSAVSSDPDKMAIITNISGMNSDQLIAYLGDPTFIYHEGQDDKIHCYEYKDVYGFNIIFKDDNELVDSVVIESSEICINGISLWMNFKDIWPIWGKADVQTIHNYADEGDYDTYYVEYTIRNMNVKFTAYDGLLNIRGIKISFINYRNSDNSASMSILDDTCAIILSIRNLNESQLIEYLGKPTSIDSNNEYFDAVYYYHDYGLFIHFIDDKIESVFLDSDCEINETSIGMTIDEIWSMLGETEINSYFDEGENWWGFLEYDYYIENMVFPIEIIYRSNDDINRKIGSIEIIYPKY